MHGVNMMQAVEEKLVINEVKIRALEKTLNEWGAYGQGPYLKDGFSEVSPNLLEQYGFIRKDGSLRLTCFVDLLNQAYIIVRDSQKYLGSIEPYFLDEIILPDDKKGVILITQNIDGKMSIKLPREA